MNETWSPDDNAHDGDDPTAVGVARRAIPVVTDGGAADAWRRAAQIVAWVGVVMGMISFASIVLSQLDVRGRFTFRYVREAFVAANWADKVLMILQLTGIALAGLVVLGSVGVLARRRWGASALIVFAAAVPVVTVGQLVAIAFSRTYGAMTGNLFAWFMIQYALANLTYLAFPAVVFFVMRAARPHLGKPAAVGSAFEPLPRPT